jgi:hypothetical protein
MVTERCMRPMVRIEEGYVLNVHSRIRTEAVGGRHRTEAGTSHCCLRLQLPGLS